MKKCAFKKFWNISIPALVVASVASLLFIVDSLIAPLIVSEATFMWVAFVNWTVFASATCKDRVKAFIGYIIGFMFAVGMIYFGGLFGASVFGIGIASLLGVFIANGIVMYFTNLKKFWLDSIPGIFVGIGLTFSGLGVGMSPTTGIVDALIIIGILLLYGTLGLICGWATNFFIKYIKNKTEDVFEEEKKGDIPIVNGCSCGCKCNCETEKINEASLEKSSEIMAEPTTEVKKEPVKKPAEKKENAKK